MYPRETLRQALALYAVTDRAWLEGRTLSECVEAALCGGATFIQLRDKEAPSAELVMRAHVLAPLCKQAGVPFVVNDDIRAALLSSADGVHVGQGDTACSEARRELGPDKIVGVSVSSVAQAVCAQQDGADYIGVGAMFATSTKMDASEVSLDEVRAICKAVSIPVVAIGGLTQETIPQLVGTGIDGVAVVSAIFSAENIKQATQDLKKIAKETLCLETI